MCVARSKRQCHRVVSILLAILLASTLDGCSGRFLPDPEPPGGGEQTATLVGELAYNQPAVVERCTATLEWVLQPVSITGSGGRSNEIRGSKTSEVNATRISVDPPASGCVHSFEEFGLAPGTWNIVVAMPPGSAAQCEKQLGPGRTTARFTQFQAGCV
jgi:hypothetical protein